MLRFTEKEESVGPGRNEKVEKGAREGGSELTSPPESGAARGGYRVPRPKNIPADGAPGAKAQRRIWVGSGHQVWPPHGVWVLGAVRVAGNEPGTRTWMVSRALPGSMDVPWEALMGSPGKFETKKHHDQIRAQ